MKYLIIFSFMSINIGEFLYFIGVPLYIFFLWCWKQKNLSNKKIFLYSLFCWYFLVLIALCFFPITFWLSSENYSTQLIPLKTLKEQLELIRKGMEDIAITQMVGNVFLLAPLGFLLPFLWWWWQKIFPTIFLGIIVSIAIETTQLFLSAFVVPGSYRVFDVDDIICNSFGFAVGFLLGKYAIIHAKNCKKRKK